MLLIAVFAVGQSHHKSTKLSAKFLFVHIPNYQSVARKFKFYEVDTLST